MDAELIAFLAILEGFDERLPKQRKDYLARQHAKRIKALQAVLDECADATCPDDVRARFEHFVQQASA